MHALKSHLCVFGARSFYNKILRTVMLTISCDSWYFSFGFQNISFVKSAEREINPSIMTEMNSIPGCLQLIRQNANLISANMLFFLL